MPNQRDARQMESYLGIEAQIKDGASKAKIEERETAFQSKLETLARKTAEIIEKQGMDDNISRTMIAFLDVGLQLKTFMETLNNMSLAFECLTDALGFVDSVIQYDDELFQQTLAANYGWLARWKRKRMMKKAMRNNVGRIKTMLESIVYKYKLVEGLSASLGKLGVKLNKEMQRKMMRGKNKKGASAPDPNGRALAFIHEVCGDGAAAESAAADASYAPSAPGVTERKNGALPDVSDITDR